VSRLCFHRQLRTFVRPFPPVGTVAAPCGSPAVPHLPWYYGLIRLLVHRSSRLRFPLAASYSLREEMASSPGFLENPFGSMPRARDSGDPGATSRYRSTESCLPPCQRRRHRNQPIFGAESSWPASSLCTLRTHQSPDEWQHSLPACSLALAGRDLRPLDSIKKFHRLIFGSSSSKLSQRDDDVGGVKYFLSTLRRALRKESHFALVEGFAFAFPTVGSLVIVSGQDSVRPMHLFGHNRDHDY
jgi:hypothetical protein